MNSYYDVSQYGILPNCGENLTQPINQLIEKIHSLGGGTIFFPSGEYLTGPVCLLSNITLYLSEGAVLLGSGSYEDYPMVTASELPGWGMDTHSGLICARDAENIAVCGRGTINGQGWHWWHKKFDDRPRCLEFIGCSRILIKDIRIINSPMWTIHPVHSEIITIHNVTIQNPVDSPNTDGINPESCRNIHISNCHISVGDDCIAIKSGREFDTYIKEWASENITITNCTMAGGHGGIVIGSEMSGGVRNVTISNCIFQNTDRGFRVKTRRLRGGTVENIRVSNIIMEHVYCPLIINCYYPCATLPDDEEYCSSRKEMAVTDSTPIFRNLFFSDIIVQNATAAAGFISGLPEMPVEGLFIDNMTVNMASGTSIAQEPAMTYEHKKMAGEGFLIEYANHVVLTNVTINCKTAENFSIHHCSEVTIR